jgi:hypothetical protein
VKNTRIVAASAVNGLAAMLSGALPGSEELPNGREREDECVDRRGTALWWSVFTFFMEGFAAYGASMHPTAAFPLRLP